MANAVENALTRASEEQRKEALSVIEEARRHITLVSVRDDISSVDANHIAKHSQAIEEAKRTIPFETMKDVDSISSPLSTPAGRGTYNATVVELHANTQSTIERVEAGEGNNYLRENAVDRAMNRPGAETYEPVQHQQARSR